nr:MAG TPA: hypothetical protein [Microviridae sp.]
MENLKNETVENAMMFDFEEGADSTNINLNNYK